MKHFAVGCLIVSLAAGCSTPAANLEQVRAGMDRTEVLSIIGQPETSWHTPSRECTFYTLTKDFWMRTPWTMSSRYYVCYEDGKVQSFGRADSTHPGPSSG